MPIQRVLMVLLFVSSLNALAQPAPPITTQLQQRLDELRELVKKAKDKTPPVTVNLCRDQWSKTYRGKLDHTDPWTSHRRPIKTTPGLGHGQVIAPPSKKGYSYLGQECKDIGMVPRSHFNEIFFNQASIITQLIEQLTAEHQARQKEMAVLRTNLSALESTVVNAVSENQRQLLHEQAILDLKTELKTYLKQQIEDAEALRRLNQ